MMDGGVVAGYGLGLGLGAGWLAGLDTLVPLPCTCVRAAGGLDFLCA